MFRVEWAMSARERVVAAWDAARPDLRESIMDAVDLIDRLLAESPEQAGESREPGSRILVAPPLSVNYWLNVRLQRVYVYTAIVFGKDH